MATHDYVIANGTGAAVRSDLNNALAAIVSNNSSATEPTTTYAYMWWADTTAGQLKLRNAADNAWVTIQELDGTMLMEDGTVGSPGLAFASDLDTGFYRPTTNALGIATNGTAAIYVDASQRVGIGTSPISLLHVSNGTSVASLNADADDFYISNAGNVGMTLGTNASGKCSIYFAELGTSNNRGRIIYDTSTEGLEFFCNAQQRATISATGTFEAKAAAATAPFIASIGASESVRIDSSARLLVGTSSAATNGNSQYALLAVKGNTLSSGSGGLISLQRGEASAGGNITSGENIGGLVFGDNDGQPYGSIVCDADGTSDTGDYPGRLVFSTTADGASSPTERVRISKAGSLQIVSSGGADVVYASTPASAGTSTAIYRGLRNATTGSPGTGTDVFFVFSNGNVQNTNDSYGAISDIKLKENIVDAESQWDDFKAVRFRKYNFKEETGHETFTQLGVIAQELELVSPGLVTETPDRDEDGNDLGTTTKSVKYSILTKKALVALQEAMERIEALEQRLSDAGIA